MKYLHQNLTEKIIKAYYNVYNELGYGFLERVYENAFLMELKSFGLECAKQKPISVSYKGVNVGEYFADIIVENRVIIEIKACAGLIEEHEAQLLNYLRATDIEVGLLFNFGKKPQFKRQIFENIYKKSV